MLVVQRIIKNSTLLEKQRAKDEGWLRPKIMCLYISSDLHYDNACIIINAQCGLLQLQQLAFSDRDVCFKQLFRV